MSEKNKDTVWQLIILILVIFASLGTFNSVDVRIKKLEQQKPVPPDLTGIKARLAYFDVRDEEIANHICLLATNDMVIIRHLVRIEERMFPPPSTGLVLRTDLIKASLEVGK